MSVHAGSIIHVGGNSVIDRIQSAGLGDVRLPINTIRETGNREVVDKVPGEPDFTFTLESFDVGTDIMAWLTGSVGSGLTASGAAPGAGDADGTEYDWLDCQFVNIPSPWKDPATGSAGTVEAGHLIPGYYVTRMTQRYGVTDNATFTVELGGGSFYYAKAAPVEEYFTGDGGKDFETTDVTVHYREGGVEGTTFRDLFGVIVDGLLQTEDVDYVVTGGNGTKATITFTTAPAVGAQIKLCYFTSAAKSFPQSVHASTVVKPGAVRGRNIKIEIEDTRIGGGQTFELDATVDGEVERELGNSEIVGRTVNGTDVNGTFTIRAKDADAFFNLLEQVTGVSQSEVYGWFNDHTVKLAVKIENPKNPGEIIKTILIDDAKFQPPGTPARVNQPTDFAVQWESVNGTFKEVKGEPV